VGFVTSPVRPATRSVLAAAAVSLALLGPASSAWAGAPTDALRDFFGGVNVVLTDPATEEQPFERLRLIRRYVNDTFDFREAAKLALGREWTARTPKEQNEFVAMFGDLLERSFVWRVAGKASLGGGVKVRYLQERVTGDSATVDTELAARDGNEIQLQYHLVRRSGRWVVCDVVMDGVSTMQNYHAQFQRIVRESSYAVLASQLRAKLGMSAVGAQVTPIPIAAAAPPAPTGAPLGSREIGGPIDLERQAIARDVAAVVTPGLVASDLTAATPRPAPATPATSEPARGVGAQPTATPAEPSSHRAAAAPPPVGPVPITSDSSMMRIQSSTAAPAPTATPAPIPSAPIAAPAATAVGVPVPTPGQAASSTVAASPVMATPVKAPTPRVSAPTPVHATPGTGFWVQVGAYRDTATAGRVAKAVNGEILIVADTAGGAARPTESPLLRVRVGPFVERTQAVSKARDLTALGYTPFIAAGE
jgi:phospholipid transport system substrate-binding protein